MNNDTPADQYAVIGNPIEHSKSPQIHRLFAEQTGEQIEYGKILGDINNFTASVETFWQNGGKGLNVTVPFKEQAFDYVDELSERAKLAGAVNTITRDENGQTTGDNTDGIGLVKDLHNHADRLITGERILILGAGGATRGVLQPLLEKKPAGIFIANRTAEKALALADIFGDLGNIHGGGFADIPDGQFDIIINATSASISGDIPPVPPGVFTKTSLAYDMMYGNQPTAFLLWAHKQSGCKIRDGLGMLVGQAAASFKLWRGVKPDVQPVMDTLRKGE